MTQDTTCPLDKYSGVLLVKKNICGMRSPELAAQMKYALAQYIIVTHWEE